MNRTTRRQNKPWHADASMASKYASECASCGGRYEVGERIAPREGRWMHHRCAAEYDLAERERPVCVSVVGHESWQLG